MTQINNIRIIKKPGKQLIRNILRTKAINKLIYLVPNLKILYQK
jgi:hypothetical protein